MMARVNSYAPVVVELVPAPGLDLQNDPEEAVGALVSTNIRRDKKSIRPCQPTLQIAVDGSDAVIGLHFHWQQDASVMRVVASTYLYLDGVAAHSVVTETDYAI